MMREKACRRQLFRLLHKSLADYAEELTEGTTEIPESIYSITSTMNAWGAIWN